MSSLSVCPRSTTTRRSPSSSMTFPSSASGSAILVRKLSREARLPERVQELRRELLLHVLDDRACRHCACPWEALPERADAERMIAMPMGDVDSLQHHALRCNPVSERACLVPASSRGPRERVALAIDEGRRDRREHPLRTAAAPSARHARSTSSDNAVPRTARDSEAAIHERDEPDGQMRWGTIPPGGRCSARPLTSISSCSATCYQDMLFAITPVIVTEPRSSRSLFLGRLI